MIKILRRRIPLWAALCTVTFTFLLGFGLRWLLEASSISSDAESWVDYDNQGLITPEEALVVTNTETHSTRVCVKPTPTATVWQVLWETGGLHSLQIYTRIFGAQDTVSLRVDPTNGGSVRFYALIDGNKQGQLQLVPCDGQAIEI